jgi:hypothetical protein
MAKGSRKPDKSAASQAEDNLFMCAQPAAKPLILPFDLPSARALAITISAKKWVNGTVLHYHFLDRSIEPKWTWAENQKQIVRWAFGVWRQLGIGLLFVEVSDETEAEIRIGCLRESTWPNQNRRSWSYVGTDNLSNEDLGRTMNFGWDLTTAWGKATALHEIGHAIGMSHEHQNPLAGIVWDEKKVYDYYKGPPNNWDQPTTYHNILRKLDLSEVEGSKWDPASIMHYPVRPGLISSPKPYDTQGVGENTVLSPADKAWVKSWYPPTDKPVPIAVMQLERLNAMAGEQRDYAFEPEATREYKINTVGESDCRVVVFELRDNEPRHFISEDDSGADVNVSIKTKMVKGRTYIIRVRVNYVTSPDGVGLLIS